MIAKNVYITTDIIFLFSFFFYICTFLKSRQFKSRYKKYMISLSIPVFVFFFFEMCKRFCFLKMIWQFIPQKRSLK